MFASENVSIYLSGPTGQKREPSGCGLSPSRPRALTHRPAYVRRAKMAAPRVPGGADALPHKEKPEALFRSPWKRRGLPRAFPGEEAGRQRGKFREVGEALQGSLQVREGGRSVRGCVGRPLGRWLLL